MRNISTNKIINAPIPKARGFCGKGVLTPSSIWMTFDGISPNPCSSATIYNGTKRIAIIRNNPIPPNALAFNLNLVIYHHLGKLQLKKGLPVNPVHDPHHPVPCTDVDCDIVQ